MTQPGALILFLACSAFLIAIVTGCHQEPPSGEQPVLAEMNASPASSAFRNLGKRAESQL